MKFFPTLAQWSGNICIMFRKYCVASKVNNDVAPIYQILSKNGVLLVYKTFHKYTLLNRHLPFYLQKFMYTCLRFILVLTGYVGRKTDLFLN